jgi:hypothetical protein
MNNSTHKLALAITASILAACGAQGYELNLGTNLPPIDFHGFLSQGYLDSSKYNYLGDSSRGTFDFTEVGVNASMNPFPRTRIAAQGFDFDVGNVGEYHPFLDYALAEYTVNDYIGIRVGRIRRPSGIYNATQDIDLARTSVLLPQGVYDARWRDFSCSMDGGEFFGSIPLSKAGDLSYEIYGGLINMADDGGVARSLESGIIGTGLSFQGIDQCQIYGGQLWYNTPVDGLRFGVSAGYLPNFGYTIGAGPEIIHSVSNIPFGQASAEYLWKAWTFQAEYYTYNISGNQYVYYYGTPVATSSTGSTQKYAWYGSAAYRFNKWFEAGAYYMEDYENTDEENNSKDYQKDVALSFRFDPTDWWVFKIEGHYIHGTGLLDDNASNPNQSSNGWFMLAVKTTFSF